MQNHKYTSLVTIYALVQLKHFNIYRHRSCWFSFNNKQPAHLETIYAHILRYFSKNYFLIIIRVFNCFNNLHLALLRRCPKGSQMSLAPIHQWIIGTYRRRSWYFNRSRPRDSMHRTTWWYPAHVYRRRRIRTVTIRC